MNKLAATALSVLLAASGAAFAAKGDKTAKGAKHGDVVGIVKAIDAEKGTITVETRSKEKKGRTDQTLTVSKDVKLADVKVGDRVALKVSGETTVTAIETHAKKKQK